MEGPDEEDGNEGSSADENTDESESEDESGDNTEDTDSEQEEEPEEDEEEEGTDYELEGEANLEILEHELVVEEGEFMDEVFVEAMVENTGDGPSGPVELQADWYDADGNYLDNATGYLQTLPAGETWEARVYALASEPEEIDDYEFSGEFDVEPKQLNPEGLEVQESELLANEDEVVIEGQIANNTGESQDYVEVIATIYDADGVVLGDEWTNVSDLPEGETWAFDMTWLERQRADRAADHVIYVADRAF